MKRLFVLIPAMLLVMLAASRCDARKDDGIQFYDRSWQEVLNKAKAEHKMIFLDIYASWCGPCKMLKRQTFPDQEVGEYFNSHFINTSFDGEVGDGIMLARKFKIEGYPALFILDWDGNVVTNTMGYQSPRELIKFGKYAAKGK